MISQVQRRCRCGYTPPLTRRLLYLTNHQEARIVTGRNDPLGGLLNLLFRAHPWHGVPIGEKAPEIVTCYIEIVPTDTIKYEIDKITGYLKIDRPQQFSNICPTPYGFIPQTLCAEKVAEKSIQKTGRQDIIGDGDPLDICVLTEKNISHGDLLLKAIPIGGMRMLDGNEADDKLIAVLEGDAVYGGWRDIQECPQGLVDRLRHYFLTYKEVPGVTKPRCEITHIYGREEAHELIRRSQEDYRRHFGISDLLASALRGR